jgi:DNA processing protein
VVVEAGWRSGSTSTANHAASLGRLVAAIPGDISRQESRGANKLIRDRKAELIGSAEDLIELIDSLELAPVTRQTDFGPLEVRLLDALTYRPKSLDRLCSETGMSLREVAVAANSLKNQGLAQFELGAWRKLNP